MSSADNCELVRGDRTVADQQDSIDMVFTQVQQPHINAQEAPRMIPRMEMGNEDDQVFLCGFTSDESFVGHLEDKDGISDQVIEDFIRQNNPDMFRRLFTNEGVFTEGQGQMNGDGYDTPTLAVTSGGMAATQESELSSSASNCFELQDVLLQIKRLLVSFLLGGHILVLQKLTVSYTICDHPYCQFSNAPIRRGSFILQLRLEGSLEVRHFCLGCIESIFFCPSTSAAQSTTNLPLAPMVSLDGMAEVIKAAQNLAAPLPKGNSVPLSPPKCKSFALRPKGNGSIENYFPRQFSFEHPSNSLQALSMRRRRQSEIDDILADVEKYQKRREDDSGQSQNSPLVITPPTQMPGEERYKKQGLGRYDKEKQQRLFERRDFNSGGSGTSTISTVSLRSPICKCREPSGVGVVLRCIAEFCPTGLFHLECTALYQQPTANIVWTCSDCSGLPEGSLVAAVACDVEGDMEPGDENNYDYDYNYEDDDYDDNYDDDYNDNGETSFEDFDSHAGTPMNDRDSTATSRETASPDDFPDSDDMSTLTGVRDSSPKEPKILPRATHSAIESSLVGQRRSEFPVTPPRYVIPTNSFTPINPDRTPGTITPLSIGHVSPFSLDGGSSAERQVTAPLPVGWSEVTFEDLAPFITAETNVASYRTLSPEHMGMLEEWRAACPMSRLLPGQRALNPVYSSSVQTVPLSHLLAMVEEEMADK